MWLPVGQNGVPTQSFESISDSGRRSLVRDKIARRPVQPPYGGVPTAIRASLCRRWPCRFELSAAIHTSGHFASSLEAATLDKLRCEYFCQPLAAPRGTAAVETAFEPSSSRHLFRCYWHPSEQHSWSRGFSFPILLFRDFDSRSAARVDVALRDGARVEGRVGLGWPPRHPRWPRPPSFWLLATIIAAAGAG